MGARGLMRGCAFALAALLIPNHSAFAEEPERTERIRIRPVPIGAAAKLMSKRTLESNDAPELPIDGLVPATLPDLQPRATLSTATSLKPLGTIATIDPSRTFSTTVIPTQTVTSAELSAQSVTRPGTPAPVIVSGSVPTIPVLTPRIDTSTAETAISTKPTLGSDVSLRPALPTLPVVLQPLPGVVRPRPSPGGIGGGTTTPGGTTGGGVPPPEPPSAGDAPTPDDATSTGAEQARRDRLPPEQIAQIVVEKLQLLAQIREERLAREQLEQQQREQIDGPSALGSVNLLEGLHVDAKVSLDVADILRVEHEVYQDGNAKSGRFYYLPARYDLAWDAEHQYALTVIYGSAESEGAEGQVLMAARLQSGVDSRELDVVRELLRAYVRRHAQEREIRFEALAPFALAGTTDISLFGGAQNEFTIPKDQISVQGASELLGAIDVSWAADQRRLLNVESLLRTKAGIHGQIGLLGAGAARLARALPLAIDVASPRTFGRIAFERDGGFRNATHYPLRFRTLHALVIARNSKGRVREGDPVVYSWSLSDTRVPPGAAVEWDASEVPDWLDVRALLQWVDYAVEGDCEACDERVFDEKFIPSAAATRAVVMTASDVFAATGAARLAVRIRSTHLTPSGELAALPQSLLTEDGAPKTMARLFVADAELASEAPLYEYQLELTFPDGRSYVGAEWTPTRNLDLLLGSENVRRLVALPAEPPPAEPLPAP